MAAARGARHGNVVSKISQAPRDRRAPCKAPRVCRLGSSPHHTENTSVGRLTGGPSQAIQAQSPLTHRRTLLVFPNLIESPCARSKRMELLIDQCAITCMTSSRSAFTIVPAPGLSRSNLMVSLPSNPTPCSMRRYLLPHRWETSCALK